MYKNTHTSKIVQSESNPNVHELMKWIKTVVYLYIIYYLTIKDEILIHDIVPMNFEDTVLRCSESEGFQGLSIENHDYAFLAADNELLWAMF